MIALPGKATPKTTAQEKMQAEALKKLMKERQAYAAKHNGNYPSDAELLKSRKKIR
jgi:hypothetical protein